MSCGLQWSSSVPPLCELLGVVWVLPSASNQHNVPWISHFFQVEGFCIGQIVTYHSRLSPHNPRPHVYRKKTAYFNGQIMILLLFLGNLTALISSFPFCDFSIQMQSWLGTFNPERERRKVMSFLATACLGTHTHTYPHTLMWTHRAWGLECVQD